MTETFTLLPATVEVPGWNTLEVTTVLPGRSVGSNTEGSFDPTAGELIEVLVMVVVIPLLKLGWEEPRVDSVG